LKSSFYIIPGATSRLSQLVPILVFENVSLQDMKTSLAHLPEKKQVEIDHIVKIIKEVVDPEMIILFGSYAKGKQVDHRYQGRDGIYYEYISDYDFLVVVNKVVEETSNHEWTIEEKAQIYRAPVNLEIHEVEYINKGLETGQYFFADIIKEGIVLFDNGSVAFAEPRQLSSKEKKQIADDYFEKWFASADRFLKYSELSLEEAKKSNEPLNEIAFMLHQVAERLYYTMLLVFTGYKPKTHNLQKLRRKSKHLSEDLFLLFAVEKDNEEKHLFEQLKRGYLDARYKSNYSITSNEIDILFDRIRKMKELVKDACLNEIEKYK